MRHSLIASSCLLLILAVPPPAAATRSASAAPAPAINAAGDVLPAETVVAKVGDRAITLRELNAETPVVGGADPAAVRAAQSATLGDMVVRAIVAQAAVDQGIDASPDFALNRRRAIDMLLMQGLEAKFAAEAQKVTEDDAARYMAAHANIFAQRKIFTVDQIRSANPNDPMLVKQLEPLKTMAQVEALFTQRAMPFQRSTVTVDAVDSNPQMVDAIVGLPLAEVFVIPNKDAMLVGQIKETRIVPFTGPKATDYAVRVLTRQRAQESVTRQVKALFDKARPTVSFSPGFTPPSAPPPSGAH